MRIICRKSCKDQRSKIYYDIYTLYYALYKRNGAYVEKIEAYELEMYECMYILKNVGSIVF